MPQRLTPPRSTSHVIAGTRDDALRAYEGEASALLADRLHLVPELGRAVAPRSDVLALVAAVAPLPDLALRRRPHPHDEGGRSWACRGGPRRHTGESSTPNTACRSTTHDRPAVRALYDCDRTCRVALVRSRPVRFGTRRQVAITTRWAFSADRVAVGQTGSRRASRRRESSRRGAPPLGCLGWCAGVRHSDAPRSIEARRRLDPRRGDRSTFASRCVVRDRWRRSRGASSSAPGGAVGTSTTSFGSIPRRRRARELLDAFDVFVHTSSFEGLPMVVLEAMAAGVPVVAQAAGGTAEVVHDQETGRLVPIGDVPRLAVAIEDLLTDRERAERLAWPPRPLSSPSTTPRAGSVRSRRSTAACSAGQLPLRTGSGRFARWSDRASPIDRRVRTPCDACSTPSPCLAYASNRNAGSTSVQVVTETSRSVGRRSA